jgi:hypothetical protein
MIEISTLITKSSTEIKIPMPKSKFRCLNRTINRNSDFDNEIEIFENRNSEILTKLEWNYVGISILSQVKGRNRNIKISTKFKWNFVGILISSEVKKWLSWKPYTKVNKNLYFLFTGHLNKRLTIKTPTMHLPQPKVLRYNVVSSRFLYDIFLSSLFSRFTEIIYLM